AQPDERQGATRGASGPAERPGHFDPEPWRRALPEGDHPARRADAEALPSEARGELSRGRIGGPAPWVGGHDACGGPLRDHCGAGFPGIVLGCLRPDLEIVLIESRRRRASFLREAIRVIPLTAVRAVEMRAEEAAIDSELAGRARVAIARGLRLDVFLGLAVPLLTPHGTAIAMQTPRTSRLAPVLAASHGLRLAARHDYSL